MRRTPIRILPLLYLIGAACNPTISRAQELVLFVQREYTSWENPLHSELTINDELINIYSSDTHEPVSSFFKTGWNHIVVTTRPQTPASKNNGLRFRIGPVVKAEKSGKMTLSPPLWEFHNDTDWKFKDGKFSHPLGPDVREVSHSFDIYYTGSVDLDRREVNAGDYIVHGAPRYSTWGSPLIVTAFVNGIPINSFVLAERGVVVTSTLQKGRNQLKIIVTRVENAVKNNDIEIQIMGPAEWNVQKEAFVFKPIVELSAKQGWKLSKQTGMLENEAAPSSDRLERSVDFIIRELPGSE